MRRILILALAVTSCAFAQDAVDDGAMTLTPAEHRALAQKMLDLQEQIDDLTDQLSKAKEKFNVQHNCA